MKHKSTSPVCVIITAWNQVDKTIPCLESVQAQTYADLHVMLVDNGSEDVTVEQVSRRFPEVQIVSLPQNLGPTKGFNEGFTHALAQGYSLLFLLNNDTVLAPDCVEALVVEAQSADEIGLVMPKIYFADEPSRIWSIGARASSWNLEVVQHGSNQLDTGQWDEAVDIDFAPLCAVLVKREMLESVGLPDEQFFLYYEDMDFCRRARSAGFRFRMAPAAKVWHLVSASSGGSDSPQERYWMARSSVRYFRKHVRGWRWPIVIFWRSGSAVKTSWRLIRSGRSEALVSYWRGLWHGIRGIPWN